MYTKQDYQSNRSQLYKRSAALGAPALIMLALLVWSFIVRIKVLTMALTIVLGAYCIFCYGLLLFPIIAYGRHLHSVLFDRTHTLTGAFKEMAADKVLRDGVEFYAVLINVGNMQDPEDDRLLYYDANLETPDWQVGEAITFTAHDKSIGHWAHA